MTRDHGHHLRPGVGALADSHDLPLRLHTQPTWVRPRRGRAIPKRSPPTPLVAAPPPIPAGAAGPAQHRSLVRPLPRLDQHHQSTPRLPRKPHPTGRLHTLHHPGLLGDLWTSTSTRLAGGPDNVSRLAGVWSIHLDPSIARLGDRVDAERDQP